MDGYKATAITWEATAESLMILLLALVAALAAGSAHCSEFDACLFAKSCVETSSRAGLSCSFSNFVSVESDSVYGQSNGSSFSSSTRGVCAPGERLVLSSVTGAVECSPRRTFPDAFDYEIAAPAASSFHEQACGRWIDAGPLMPTRVETWAFSDTPEISSAIQNAAAKTYRSARLSSRAVGKFFSSCSTTVVSGSLAIRASAVAAYAYLVAPLQSLATTEGALKALGWLASHACDGPALVATTENGFGRFAAKIVRGSAFVPGELSRALYSVGASSDLQSRAESGNRFVNANAFNSPEVSLEDIEYLYEGAAGRTDHDAVPLVGGITPELDGLVMLSNQGGVDEVAAYVHGVAAQCAFSLQGALDIESTGSVALRAPHAPRAPALGRVEAPPVGQLLDHVDNSTLQRASTVTWAALEAHPVGNAVSDCTTLAIFLFPDRMDETQFNLVVTAKLYDRLQELNEVLRSSLIDVLENFAPIRSVFSTLASVQAIQSAISNTRVRIAGAPRGSWAGMERGLADGEPLAEDGPMLMALKQAKAMFTDRSTLAFDGANACAAPAVYDGLSANAYVYPGGGCSHILLGVLRRPFADESYDNASLASRIGYVLAHELAHNSIVSAWQPVPLRALLTHYDSQFDAEALADVMAAVAIVRSGLATAEQVCRHVSQLWCARVPAGFSVSATDVHPPPNVRGDALCQTLALLNLD